jgi:hypothetical protein
MLHAACCMCYLLSIIHAHVVCACYNSHMRAHTHTTSQGGRWKIRGCMIFYVRMLVSVFFVLCRQPAEQAPPHLYVTGEIAKTEGAA